MDYNSICQLGMLLGNVYIPEINENTNFWMMRAKGGFFYNEFLNDGFIALGWNYIDSKTSFDKQGIENAKEGIRHWYGDKVPMTAINKCKKFIEEVKEGDYVVIPDKGSTQIAICIVGEYYEEDELDTNTEVIEIRKIENKEYEIGKAKCPYKKRRRIEVLLEISASRMGHNLSRALGICHGLSSLNDYATDVLNCIYDCYIYKKDIVFPINVAKRTPIKAREISRLLYGVSEVFCEFMDEEDVSITINLNSPGKLVVWLKQGYEKIKKGAVPLLILFVALFGGGIEGLFETPGIASGIINTFKDAMLMKTEIEIAKEELEGQKLDNYLKAMDLIEKTGNGDVDVEKALNNLEFLLKIGNDLEFESNREFATEKENDVNDNPE